MTPNNRKTLHPKLRMPVQPRDGVRGIERPKALLEVLAEDNTSLKDLAWQHIVTAKQFDKKTVNQLCRLAATYESMPELLHRPLQGKILISAFYEPSTRTRLSFESAWHRLGGDVMSITDPSTTGIAKGETLQDVGEMFNNYGDVVVLRDRSEQSVYDMLDTLRIPIINAGNGIDEHPTQALSDIYAIAKWKPEFTAENPSEKISIGIIGTPGKMRTVRSLMTFLAMYSAGIEKITVINPSDDVFDHGQREQLESTGLKIDLTNRLRDVIEDLDVIYINSIAWVGDTFETLTGDIQLSDKSPMKKDAIILHPLARGEELSSSLDDTDHNWYFAQARGAVFLRMALLTCLVQRANLVADVPVERANESGGNNAG